MKLTAAAQQNDDQQDNPAAIIIAKTIIAIHDFHLASSLDLFYIMQ